MTVLKQYSCLQTKTLAFLLLLGQTSSAVALNYGDPTAFEQAHLEMINRARANPLAEAARLNIDLQEGVPPGAIQSSAVQPLSSNVLLLSIARAHSQDMLQQNYFAHNNLSGLSPTARMQQAGYAYLAAGENIAWTGTTGTINQAETAVTLHNNLFIDKDVADRGHRINLLNANFREIGVGLQFGSFNPSGQKYNAGMLTTDFGSSSNKPILLGVVYDDKNADQFYTPGEGMPNVQVTLANGKVTQTASAGGYAIEVEENQDYLINFSHPLLGITQRSVRVGQRNVKQDILRRELGNDLTGDAQCATYDGLSLQVPCVVVNGAVYAAQLVNSNASPLQFTLKITTLTNQSPLSQCATYIAQSNVARLNCVKVGNSRYWADLKLQAATSPLKFELGQFGLLP